MSTKDNETSDEWEDMDVLEAEAIYILMKNEYRISRSVRAQWFLEHLNTTISVPRRTILSDCQAELTVISVIPNQPPMDWKTESSHLYKYLVTSHSSVIFLTQKYRIVYCLDMSPSLSAVDIQHGEVMIDEMFLSLKRSLNGLTMPFVIPGSSIEFRPQIFVTVIAHTPFFTTPAQQVLVQGWQVTPQNLPEFLMSVKQQLEQLEDTVAEVAGIAHEQLEAIRAESEKIVGGLFEENFEVVPPPSTHIPMVSPDSGFINMLRYGMLALRLLPESSCANLIILTDGIIAIPDVYVFDSVLTQLRSNTVACSFLHVGSLFHPHCCKGLVPYADLMQFIAAATFGAYMTTIPEITSLSEMQMNMYHRAFLTWNFRKISPALDLDYLHSQGAGEWHVSNSCFYGSRDPQLLRKKQVEDNLNTTLPSVLYCRLREGYTIKKVNVSENHVEVCLVLPWKNHIYIEYLVTAQWPAVGNNSSPGPGTGMVHYAISIEAPYEFLHDITCLLKKPFKSQYRQAVVSRFWATLKNLSQSDQLLVHLNSFPGNPASYTVPESIRSGMPVFYLPTNSSIPVLSSSDMTSPQFAQFWRPVCLLEPAIWQKWLHTHRMGLILQHDHPLPRHLHLPNASGRFQVVQCRQAAAALYSLLKDWSTFVLIENHSYVKLITNEDKPPTSFYIIRVTSKPPCVVINVAFLGGTPSQLRHQIVQQLKEHIAHLKLPQRPSNKDPLGRKISVVKQSVSLIHPHQMNGHSPVFRTVSDTNCCILLRKPVEKILIRYERMPSDFGTVVFPDGTQPSNPNKHQSQGANTGGGLLTTLSRYLHHRRWIWAAQDGPSSSLGLAAIARILSTITKMRLQEGFSFAHSTAGIINMVLEVEMKGCADVISYDKDESGIHPCVIQYVLFPPHTTATSVRDSGSDITDEQGVTNGDDADLEGELQIITECWIEPQHGLVINSPPERSYMENLPYNKIADVMSRVDGECISSLLTFEHLSLMCRDMKVPSPLRVPNAPDTESGLHANVVNYLHHFGSPHAVTLSEQRIHYIPFAFNLMKILPKCQQAEQLYSMFIQDLGINPPVPKDSLPAPLTPPDNPNKLLSDMLYEHLKRLHNKELFLSVEDSQMFLQLLEDRERRKFSPPSPIPCHFIKDAEDAKPQQTQSHTGSVTSDTTVCDKYPLNLAAVPKWRCFLKGISVTHIMLTFIPASYADLKLLMLTKQTLVGSSPRTVKFVTLNRPEPEENINSVSEQCLDVCSSIERLSQSNVTNSHPVGTGVNTMYLSRSSSCDTAQVPSGTRLCSEANSPLPFVKTDFLFETPFRVRASSWDTMSKRTIPTDIVGQSLDRIRAGSMDSKTRIKRPFNSPLLKLRDSKSDMLLNGKQIREGEVKKSSTKSSPKKSLSSKSSPHKFSTDKCSPLLYNYSGGSNSDSKYMHQMDTSHNIGSITLPTYVYDCPLAMLMKAIVFKDERIKVCKDLYEDRRYKLDQELVGDGQSFRGEAERKTECDQDTIEDEGDDSELYASDRSLSDDPESDDSSVILSKRSLELHCKVLSLAYCKCFVFSLFKALHLTYDINSADVQAAVDECEETLIDIDITNYLMTVCGHLKDFRIKMKVDELKHHGPENNHTNETTVVGAVTTTEPTATTITTSSDVVSDTTTTFDSTLVPTVILPSDVNIPIFTTTILTPMSIITTPTPTCVLSPISIPIFTGSDANPSQAGEPQTCSSLLTSTPVVNESNTVPVTPRTFPPLVSDAFDGRTPFSSIFGTRHSSVAQEENISQIDLEPKFPLSLLQLHFPCRDLKQLHKMIKDKFMQILTTTFKPVPSHPEFYFCAPYWDRIQLEDPILPQDGTGAGKTIPENDDEADKMTYLSGLVEFRSELESVIGTVGEAPRLHTPDGTHTSLSDSLSEIQEEDLLEEVSPLFLHLTCTLRCKDTIGSCSVRVLPTCLGELVQSLEYPDSELDLRHLKVTLDVLCLTLPPDVESVVTAKAPRGMRHTPFSSTSPIVPDDEPLMAKSVSGSMVSVHQFADETGSTDRLKHLPDYQHKAVTTSVEEIQWLMRDEIAAFLLDVFPLQEQTLDLVAAHVASSPGRSSCLLETVSLQFVFGPDQSLDRFLQEFRNLSVNGYHLLQEGHLYYLVKDKQAVSRKKNSSLIPPLGIKSVYQPPHMEDSTELWTDVRPLPPLSSDDNGTHLSNTNTTLETYASEDDPKPIPQPKRPRLQGVTEVQGNRRNEAPEDSDTDDESRNQTQRRKKTNISKGKVEQWSCGVASPWNETASLTASPSLSLVQQDPHHRMTPGIEEKPSSSLKRSQSCGVSAEREISPTRWAAILAWQRRQQGTPGYRSEVSSLVESILGTEDGYEGDSSDSAEECDWLLDLETRRPSLPNFWLIMRVEKDVVTTYFHCRFLEVEANEVDAYREVQRSVVTTIKNLCKMVNQTMLLQNLHDTRMCDQLLEPESSEDIWKPGSDAPLTRNHSFSRIKSIDDGTDVEYQGSYLEATLKFMPGAFSCSVVWETHFSLHHRLKTGPGKPVFSRGIQALRTVLNRFSVNNRKNMFVYQDNSGNVFYLRLHENIRFFTKLTPTAQSVPGRSDTEDNSPGPVSRSSSVASLAAAARKPVANTPEDSANQLELRPRVRSFGEKENSTSTPPITGHSPGESNTPSVTPQPPVARPEDTVILKVHGISEAGPEVKEELVQVLQNRLDDAVLEVLSIMLERNPMCKLTPDDVHFIQRPHRSPEAVIQFSIQSHALPHLQALAYYLRQNILEFLYIPKYTDAKPEYHFQDYSQPESSLKRVTEYDLFLYNQTLSAGNRGIACIAMAVVDSPGNLVQHSHYPKPLTKAYKERMTPNEFISLTSTNLYEPDGASKSPGPVALLEFRIWKQGRVNLESLTQKLSAAVRHATWDLLMEFRLLTAPLSECSVFDTLLTTPSTSHVTSPHAVSEPNTPIKGKKIVKVGDVTTVVERTSSPLSITQIGKPIRETSGVSFDKYECGEKGLLHEVYHTTMRPWLDFAVQLSVPAVRKHSVTLTTRHTLAVMVKEIQNLVILNASDTSAVVFQEVIVPKFLDLNGRVFVPYNLKLNLQNCQAQTEQGSTCLVICRNLVQWKACVTDDGSYDQDALFPKAQKVFQKFSPLLLTQSPEVESTHFVPRQRFLLAILTNQQIVIYTYNWSKERVEILNKQTKNLGYWLSARSSLLTSIMTQKMGLFHNPEVGRTQPTNPQSQATNPYMMYMTDVEQLVKFSPNTLTLKEVPTRRSNTSTTIPTGVSMLCSVIHDVFRNCKPSRLMQKMSFSADPVVRNVQQMLDTRQMDRREDQKKLYVMWHTRVATPNIPMSEDVIHVFKQHSRVIHYCLTPLLFLPRWCIQSAATRDHLLSLTSTHTTPHSDIKTKVFHHSRRSSGGGPLKNSESEGSPGVSKAAATPSPKLRRDSEEMWHVELCSNFIHEYKQYLQTLGFIPIQMEVPLQRKGLKSGVSKLKEGEDVSRKSRTKERPGSVCYLQKSLLGGILLFEISMCEPFFVAKLHALECSRLQSKTSSGLVSQFTLTFLDECDKIKILMHLHSFTYDYHLRIINGYVSGHHSLLKQGYHLTHFLDDFLKYYSKAPNFARNLVFADVMSEKYVTTQPHQLFNYLLSHEKVYNMEVFRMVPVTHETDSGVDNEYVLVQLESTPHVTYRDAHDMNHTDDFNVTLIVSHDTVAYDLQRSSSDQSILHLKFYLILTSRRELFPKLEIGQKLGKFCTVSTVTSSTMQFYHQNLEHQKRVQQTSAQQGGCDVPVPVLAPHPPPDSSDTKDERAALLALFESMGIRQEAVNYLGYYSSHEQLMQELIRDRALVARIRIHDMVSEGMVHCRTHLLWNKLQCTPSTGKETDRRKEDPFNRDMLTSGLTYNEFWELCGLAVVEPLSHLDPRLGPLLCQSLSWYQALAKVLMSKYSEHYRLFVAPEGNVQHVVVLHPRYLEAFMMLSIDSNTSRGDLCAVYRKSLQDTDHKADQLEFSLADIQSLVEGFVNACCFHLWVGLL